MAELQTLQLSRGKFWQPVLEMGFGSDIYYLCLVDALSKGSYGQETWELSHLSRSVICISFQ